MARREQLQDGYVAIGKVLGSWGLRGEVKVASFTDFPDRFSQGQSLLLHRQAITVEMSRLQGEKLLLKLQGVDTRTQADALRGALLEVRAEDVRPLPPGELYRYELVGLKVWTTAGAYLGRVEEVLGTGSNDVLLVRDKGREHAIPHLDGIVREVDLAGQRVVIEAVPGLLEEEPSAKEKE